MHKGSNDNGGYLQDAKVRLYSCVPAQANLAIKEGDDAIARGDGYYAQLCQKKAELSSDGEGSKLSLGRL